MMLEIGVYESIRGGRRQIFQSGGSVAITTPRQGPPVGMGGGGASVIQGRRGYAFNWVGSATRL